jgi:hypothetical protein
MHHVPDHEWASFFFIHGLAECSLRFKPKRAHKKAQLFYSLSLPRLLTFYYRQILYIFWKVVSNRTIMHRKPNNSPSGPTMWNPNTIFLLPHASVTPMPAATATMAGTLRTPAMAGLLEPSSASATAVVARRGHGLAARAPCHGCELRLCAAPAWPCWWSQSHPHATSPSRPAGVGGADDGEEEGGSKKMLFPKMLQHFIKCWRKITKNVEEKML